MISVIKKRNNKAQAFTPEKTNALGAWAVAGTDLQWSQLVMQAVRKLNEPCTTADLMSAMIKSAEDLLNEDLQWDKVSARLQLANLRKEVFGSFTPPSLKAFYHAMVDRGIWKKMPYTDEELDELGSHIDHTRDELFTGGGIKQVITKYLIMNRNTKEVLETPQFMYMGAAMAGMVSEEFGYDLQEVKDKYDQYSLWIENVPTPVLLGLRTPKEGFASCCLIEAADTLDSLNTADGAAFMMTANRAGIGTFYDIRSLGDSIRDGEAVHGGKLPYFRRLKASIAANVQAGRGGSGTTYFKYFDPEVETLLKLRSEKVSEATRIVGMDYCIMYNNFLLKLISDGEDLVLFSLLQAPKLHEAFFEKSETNFIKYYYEACAKYPDNRRIDPLSLIIMWRSEHAETGRIYGKNTYEVNRRSTFKDAVKQSNLCLEIVQPTGPFTCEADLHKPYETFYHNPATGSTTTSEISLCTLAAHNIDKTADMSDDQLERVTYLTVKGLDNLIDIQTYPFENLRFTSRNRRNLGIGLTNVAAALAHRHILWDTIEARDWIHKEYERISFFIHKASIRLAKERGACGWYERTTYSDGIFPWETAKKEVDELTTIGNQMPWDDLRPDMREYGIRHSVLEAMMPAESSSLASNTTNGCEPLRRFITIKQNKDAKLKFIAPYLDDEHSWAYVLAFKADMVEHIKLMAVIQKFCGGSISTNLQYDYRKYPENKIPMQELVSHFLIGNKYGIKTWYYVNTDAEAEDEDMGCAGGGCSV